MFSEPKAILTTPTLLLLFAGICSSNALAANQFLPIPIPSDATRLVARDLSADGLTVVGQVDNEAFRWSEAGGLERLGLAGGISSNADSVSADGSVVVGSFVDQSGRSQPFRWTIADGMEALIANPGPRDTGVALGVSADGQTIVGSYGALPAIEDCSTPPFCPLADTGSIAAFRWTAASGLESLGTATGSHGSQAIAVSADGSRIAGNDFDYPDLGYSPALCSAAAGFDCPVLRRVTVTFVAENGAFTTRDVRLGSAVSKISADGETVVGRSRFEAPFSHNAVTGEQLLTQGGLGEVARDVSADGAVIVGDFGVHLEGRAVVLSNLLSSAVGLSTFGWQIDSFDTLMQPIGVFGGPGLTGTSDDGLTWVGTGENPRGQVQPFLVRLDRLPTVAELDAIKPYAFGLFNLADSPLVAAVLPHSRSVTLGNTVTFAASIFNFGDRDATGCSVGIESTLPVDLAYQRVNPANNAPLDPVNTTFEIAAGEAQSLMLSLTPSAEFNQQRVQLLYDCGNSRPARRFDDVSDVQISASNTPVADILALSTTITEDGVLQLGDDGTGAFAVATRNVSTVTDTVVVTGFATGDIGAATLVEMCETNTATGACLAPPTNALTMTMAPDQTRSFGVFVTNFNDIRPRYDLRRVVVRFTDGGGAERGRTSVATANSRHLR